MLCCHLICRSILIALIRISIANCFDLKKKQQQKFLQPLYIEEAVNALEKYKKTKVHASKCVSMATVRRFQSPTHFESQVPEPINRWSTNNTFFPVLTA